MGQYFDITSAETTVQVSAGGGTSREIVFTVRNVTGRPLRARIRTLATAPAQASWFPIAGAAERAFDVDEVASYNAGIRVPDGIPEGTYQVQLQVFDVAEPTEVYDTGPDVTITVRSAQPLQRRFPWQLVAAVVGVVLIGTVLIRMLTSEPPTSEPPTSGPENDGKPEVQPVKDPVETPAYIGEQVKIVGPNNTCVTISYGISDPHKGSDIVLWECGNGDHQRWTFERVGLIRGKRMKRPNENGCIAAQPDPKDSRVVLWTCQAFDHQLWQYDKTRSRVLGRGDQCLTVKGGATQNGTPIHLAECDGSPSQQWALEFSKKS